MIAFSPPNRIEFPKQACCFSVPTIPEVAGQFAEPFVCRGHIVFERPQFAYERTQLCSRSNQSANFIGRIIACLDRLEHNHALQRTAVNKWDAQERLVSLFAGFGKVFEPRMVRRVVEGPRPHFLSNHSD